MVRHDIQDQANLRVSQRLHHPIKPFAVPDGRVDLVRIGNIIAMGGAGGRRKYRRGVKMADTEPLKIGGQRRRAIEGHAVTELNAISRGRDHTEASPCAKRTTILSGVNASCCSGQLKMTSPGISGNASGSSPIFSATESVPPANCQLTASA